MQFSDIKMIKNISGNRKGHAYEIQISSFPSLFFLSALQQVNAKKIKHQQTPLSSYQR
jgi:hypothetical protein